MCIDVTIHKDLDNILKIAIDSMCEKLEINDRKLLELHVYKKEKENYRKDKDKILVSIWML